MEKKMETPIMGYIGATKGSIPSFLAKRRTDNASKGCLYIESL